MDVIFTYQGLCLKSNHCGTKRSSSENKVRGQQTVRGVDHRTVKLSCSSQMKVKEKEKNKIS